MKKFKDYVAEQLAEAKDVKEGTGSAIASFSNRNGDYEIKVYKDGNGYYIDAGNFDMKAKNMAELKQKLKKAGADINNPNFGKLR